MNTFYTAYTRLVHGTTFYFVKKFSAFPELKGVPDILENYGMHSDFNRACCIARLTDTSIMQRLLKDIESARTVNAKVIYICSPTQYCQYFVIIENWLG